MLSCGVRALMKPTTFDLMRVWAALTGVILAVSYFAALGFGIQPSDIIPMLVTAIGGFELVLYAQDVWLTRKRDHG